MSEVIRLLPDHIANQIAAGEVIQRPASVVKELVENAIDAGATFIQLHVKDAGKTLIQVTDNGVGMSEIDARMAFERHATSKVQSADDLFALKTKGFRGEALASIAAIAQVTLKTRQAEFDLGTELKIEGSKVTDQQPCTCKVGSSFEVKNLFFNVPARRNFLKSDAVEFKHIEDEFLRVVLAHPDLQFSLIHNDQTIYHLTEGNLRKRIVDVFGRNYNDKLVPIDEETGIVRIHGYVGKPEAAKKSRGEQFFFVNDRFFKDSYFNHAVTQAYDNLLQSKTHPSYFLFFYVDPKSIDVNVHPTKTEIKFEDDREIYAILRSSVKQGLGKFNIAPSLDFEQETSFDLPWEMRNKEAIEPVIQVDPTYNPFKTTSSSGTSSSSRGNGNSPAMQRAGFGSFEQASPADWQFFYAIQEEDKVEQKPLFHPEEEQNHMQVKDVLVHGVFLLFTMKNSILVVHSKRAQERILYDDLMKQFMIQPIASQQLMFPIEFSLQESDKMLWESHRKTLERAGFTWTKDENSWSIQGAPAYLEESAIPTSVEEVTNQLKNQQLDAGEIPHVLMLTIARNFANQKKLWNKESSNQLIEELFQSSEHQFSPSGKRILNSISTEELINKF